MREPIAERRRQNAFPKLPRAVPAPDRPSTPRVLLERLQQAMIAWGRLHRYRDHSRLTVAALQIRQRLDKDQGKLIASR
jgi:hypothetical protein